jgi:galactofuranosylgalactofuranosylrhamnosyl-N-acetylglucosaminyl-diphospho-decaprenol beta-1,5/1,6-galactofuranosyltransferase
MQETVLPLLFFIKGDDAEYGLRAEEGFPRRSSLELSSGMFWGRGEERKDDELAWQAYFHQFNRLIATLLHNPYKTGNASKGLICHRC